MPFEKIVAELMSDGKSLEALVLDVCGVKDGGHFFIEDDAAADAFDFRRLVTSMIPSDLGNREGIDGKRGKAFFFRNALAVLARLDQLKLSHRRPSFC
ncbi:hypothetical protein ACOJBO_12095 [Rhizobium beringeri]